MCVWILFQNASNQLRFCLFVVVFLARGCVCNRVDTGAHKVDLSCRQSSLHCISVGQRSPPCTAYTQSRLPHSYDSAEADRSATFKEAKTTINVRLHNGIHTMPQQQQIRPPPHTVKIRVDEFRLRTGHNRLKQPCYQVRNGSVRTLLHQPGIMRTEHNHAVGMPTARDPQADISSGWWRLQWWARKHFGTPVVVEFGYIASVETPVVGEEEFRYIGRFRCGC